MHVNIKDGKTVIRLTATEKRQLAAGVSVIEAINRFDEQGFIGELRPLLEKYSADAVEVE